MGNIGSSFAVRQRLSLACSSEKAQSALHRRLLEKPAQITVSVHPSVDNLLWMHLSATIRIYYHDLCSDMAFKLYIRSFHFFLERINVFFSEFGILVIYIHMYHYNIIKLCLA